MSVKAYLDQHQEYVDLQIHTDQRRLRTTDDPPINDYAPGVRVLFYFDDEKIEDQHVWELLGVKLPSIDQLQECDLEAIDRLNPPRIDLPEVGLFNVTVSDALRYARDVYLRQRTAAKA